MTHPTTGGVTASFASVGDVILAEPKALIGFAGPRVIKRTINQELPEDSSAPGFLLQKGMIDRIVHRTELKKTIAWLLRFFAAGAALYRNRAAAPGIARLVSAASLPIGTALPPAPPPPDATPGVSTPVGTAIEVPEASPNGTAAGVSKPPAPAPAVNPAPAPSAKSPTKSAAKPSARSTAREVRVEE
jgi:hypothetical protein